MLKGHFSILKLHYSEILYLLNLLVESRQSNDLVKYCYKFQSCFCTVYSFMIMKFIFNSLVHNEVKVYVNQVESLSHIIYF